MFILVEKQLTYQEAKFKIEGWCAYQERCQYEVFQKLKLYGLEIDLCNTLISELISSNFINEERFAEAYVSGKFRIKHWGKIKIKQHLKAKFVSNYSIDKAIKQITAEDYAQTIVKLISKKAKDFKSSDSEYQKKGKIHRYLASKGYEFEAIENGIEDWATSS